VNLVESIKPMKPYRTLFQ